QRMLQIDKQLVQRVGHFSRRKNARQGRKRRLENQEDTHGCRCSDGRRFSLAAGSRQFYKRSVL
ncbi:MAG: hypothetical protein RMK20_11660, partial [Verrucomicrobiales bacterium]|nr:hypothetical protein [Verrucomicrobiales bacterium]